ncbi:MAG: LCP family protein [Clostridia bacterium]|nr:LCP family protein [Clostridia bacterium]
MEGRKLRREQKVTSKVKERKERQPINKMGLISKILMIALTVVLTAVFGIVIYLKVLPNKYLIPLCVLVLAMCVAGIFFVFTKKTSNKVKVVLSGIAGILIVIFSFVGLKLVKTLDFLGEMTTETVNAKTYSVVVLKDSEYTKLEDIQYRLLLYYDTELNQNQGAIDKLTSAMTVVTEKTDDVHELANKLIDNKVDAILIEDSYYAIIEEDIEDFKDKTKVIYTFTLEDAIATIAKEVSVTEEPFVIYVSGIDSYGKISSVARSDVNMLVVVNPKTKQILLVNTPRDYYVKLHGTSGYRDKLTHAGIYGIDMSVKTMEDLYDVDINYYVRVNFTSLIDIIDAIGGVNVYSEYDFTSRIGNYKFKKGYNQMNGNQALGFARERYSFSDGDRMRGQNQQAVIDAMIKKVCSSTTILTKFDALLDSLKGSFQTNMEYTKMVDIVRMQISDGATWNISSTSVDGSGSMERTYSMGKTLLSVLIPYAGSINQAESMIKAVLNGEMLEEGNIDISSYNDYLVVSRGVYETEEEEEKPNEELEQQPETGDETTGENPGEGTESGENTGDDTTEDSDNTGGNTDDSGNTGTGNEQGGTTGDSTGDAGNDGNAGTGTEQGGNTGENPGEGTSGDNTDDSGNTGDSTGSNDNSNDSGTNTEDTTQGSEPTRDENTEE